MLRTIVKIPASKYVKVLENARRHFSFKRIVKAFRNYIEPRPTLPYSHVCQIGDPVLRMNAEPVEPETIQTPEFQRLLKCMVSVMRTYKAFGLAAPQIGLPQQIFVLEVTKEHLKRFPENHRQACGIETIPLTIFINPKMKVTDYAVIKDEEECLSIIGYRATVPRAKSVKVMALDISGEPFVWQANGWMARMVQHEMDHLQGQLYVDRMEAQSFSCVYWMDVNNRKGNMSFHYYPIHWLRRYIQL